MANRLFWTKALSQEFWAGVVTPLMFSIAGGLIEERMARKGLRIAGLKQLEDEPFLRLLGGRDRLPSSGRDRGSTHGARMHRTGSRQRKREYEQAQRVQTPEVIREGEEPSVSSTLSEERGIVLKGEVASPGPLSP
jgi:hypothetical protein